MRGVFFIIIAGAILLIEILSGGAILNGLDSLIPRGTTPHSKPHSVLISLGERGNLQRDIWCEDYYDSQSGGRGNFWAVREVGGERAEDSSRVKASIENVGTVNFIMPTCAELIRGGGFSVDQMVLLINGVVYGHKASSGDTHTFIARHEHEGRDVELDFFVEIDGKKIRR